MKKSSFLSSISTSLIKSIAFIIGSAIFLGVSAFSLHQYEIINHQETTIQHQEDQINDLKSVHQESNYLQDEMAEENSILKGTILVLKDSIAMLHTQIYSLQRLVRSQAKTIEQLTARINKLQTKYVSLKEEISTLARAETVDKPKIKELEKEKEVIREQVRELKVEKENTVTTYDAVKEELMARQVREARYLRLNSIIANTKIKFNRVALTETNSSKPLIKLNKKDQKWRFTHLEFYMDHEDLSTLLDERFIVKIIDADNHKVLSYIEQNPNFPESSMDTKGVSFQFDGNMIELSFYNNTLKDGKNYDLQISFVDDDGKEYQLSEGARPLVMNRKVLNL